MKNHVVSRDKSSQRRSASEGIARRFELFLTMQIPVLLLISALAILCAGCSRNSDSSDKNESHIQGDKRALAVFATNTAAGEIISAGNFLRDLQMQGRLPGISKDDHGDVKAKEVTLSDPEQYPISRTFHVEKKGDNSNSRFCYTFVRATKMSGWQLEKAWRENSEGQTVEEWPVK